MLTTLKNISTELTSIKGTPIHVRGALLYNDFVRKNKLEHKYPYIQEGEKIKFIYLKTPNPLHENCVSFFNAIPKELNIDKYVDHKSYNLKRVS